MDRNVYAHLLRMSMSMDEALTTLGFPPGSRPASQDIVRAWKSKAFENHPDRGGDPMKMVEINVAKDLLEGKGRPTYDRRAPSPYQPPPRAREPEPEPEPTVVPGVELSAALSSAGIGHDIEWVLISTDGYVSGVGERKGQYGPVYVIFGKRGNVPVVATVWCLRQSNKFFHTQYEDRWGATRSTLSASFNIAKKGVQVAKAAVAEVEATNKELFSTLTDPKKWMAWPGGVITEPTLKKIDRTYGVAFKDAIIGAGLVEPVASPRKIVVEIEGVYNRDKWNARKDLGGERGMALEFVYDWSILINGRAYPLADATVKNLKANHFFFALLSDQLGEPLIRKNVTRAKGGLFRSNALSSLTLLADGLTSEPSAVVLGVMRAVEEAEGMYGKQAGLFNKLAEVLKRAMSLPEAKQVLGFPPEAEPSPAEVTKAYRQMAFQNHPDRGGDPVKMVEINTAKEVLEGRRAPSREHFDPEPQPSGGYGGYTYRTEPRAKPEPIKVEWDDAASSAGVPSGVEWKFKTATSYGGYGDNRTIGFVVYGRTDSEHVFVGVEHQRRSNPFTGEDVNEWAMYVRRHPLSESLRNLAPKVIRQLYDGFAFHQKSYNAKVEILSDSTKFTQKDIEFSRGRSVTFKDAMGMMGEVGDEDPWVKDRKLSVQIVLNKEGIIGEDLHRVVTLIINGREHKLHDRSVEKLEKARIYGMIFGTYYYFSNDKKLLTRHRNGKKILQWMSANLTDEPQDLRDRLSAAAEQTK